MARGQVLTIDDEAMVTLAVRRLLMPRYSVTAVNDALAACELLESGARFDVILSDVFMPKMTGMELYERVRALDVGQAARIVFLSGATSAQQAREFFERIPNRRLDKPVDIAVLEALIDEMVPLKGR